MRAKDVSMRVFTGVLEGLLYYALFVILIPYLLSQLFGISSEIIHHGALVFYLAVFISLGVVSSLIPSFIGILFEVLSYLLGVYILISILMRGIYRTSFDYHGVLVNAEVDFRALLLVIIGFGVVSTVITIFQRLFTSED